MLFIFGILLFIALLAVLLVILLTLMVIGTVVGTICGFYVGVVRYLKTLAQEVNNTFLKVFLIALISIVVFGSSAMLLVTIIISMAMA